MSTNFPTSLDTLTNPTSSDPLNNPSHSAQHANVNDSIEALEAKVGADNSAVTTSHDYKITKLEVVVNNASSSAPASIDLHEDTDNGTNKITITAPSAVASDKVLTLPDATDTLIGKDTTDILTNKTLENPVVRNWGGWEDANETWTYSSADGSTAVYNIASDVTAKYSPGMRVKYTQEQALSYYWTFNSSSAADVGSATMANIGTPTYTAGKFGNALTLDGSTDALSITDAAGFKPTGEFTIGCWFKTNNAGARKNIFQSYSINTSAAGINLAVDASNHLEIVVGNNTGSTAGANYTIYAGTTTVTDNNFHYVVISFRNNYVQAYLDGNLEMSGYCLTPAYAATNYVRIGCKCNAGSNSEYWNGQIDDLFIINGYALDEKTIKAQYTANAAQGTGNITVQKYGIITAVGAYSAPNTPITIWGGTDYSTANATISSPYYSVQKAPFGFPLNPAKWTVEYSSSVFETVAGPVQNTWYNKGSNLSIPIGIWHVSYHASFQQSKSSALAHFGQTTLSTSNNSESDADLTVSLASGAVTTARGLATKNKTLNLSSKTIYYLDFRTQVTSVDNIYLVGTDSKTIIRAICAYL